MSASMCFRVFRALAGRNVFLCQPGLNSVSSRFIPGKNYYSTVSSAATDENSKAAEKGPPPTGNESNGDKMQGEQTVTPKEKELLEKNQLLEERLSETEDKYKRALAENENIRMRMRRDVADAKQYGIQNFVKDMLDVADVLGKATETVPEEALKSNADLKNLYEGLQMTESQLQSIFRRYGVTQVNPLGEKFDPNFHEALFEQEDPSKEPGTVGLVTKVGYKLHDRIVRPALVGVIKAPSS